MAARYVAGASGLPFGVLRGYVGTDLVDAHHHDRARSRARSRARCSPRCRRSIPTSPSSTPSRPTARATCSSGGSSACRRKRCSRRARSIVTVEEIVDELEPRPNAVVLPSWVVDAVCHVPGGAHPSFAMGYSERDNAFYRAWDDDLARPRLVHGVDRQARAGHRRLRRVLPQRWASSRGATRV